jgi:two-component system phosphate regulon sensor histidine kinase PhoR
MGGWGAALGWGGLAALAVAVVGALALRRRAAVGELRRGLSALGEGRPARPVQGLFVGALGRLVRTFNALVPRLEGRLERLEGDRQLLGAMLQGMTEAVVAVDARRRLLFANAAADRLFELGPEAVGRLVAERLRSPQVQEAVERTLESRGEYNAEIAVPAPADRLRGQVVHLDVHGTPLPGSPAPGAVLVFHDVTDLRRLERMRQDFVANASHELKTPLASIKAYVETLLDGALHDDEVNVRFLRQIDEQAERLSALILDLLSLARLESGQDFFQHRPQPLRPLVDRCVERHRDRAEAKGLAFGPDLAGLGPDVLVHADEEAIRQILDNLIDNAIKYTPEGGRVAVGGRVAEDSVEIVVRDTGIGIPRDELPRVFERFYRVDKARSRELGGTGLGLSIVKHLAQSLGGHVWVESRVGAGSTFAVRLPRHRAARAGPEPEPEAEPHREPAGPSQNL